MEDNRILISNGNDTIGLSEREKQILQTIIHMYLLNAVPVGSRSLSKYLQRDLKLSPATIRNVMADLEERQLITHPHTSAGRVPTDKGYRIYVDSLMNIEELSENELKDITLQFSDTKAESVLKQASKLLGMISKYLSIIEIPNIDDLIVEKIEIISLYGNRILVVIALNSNIIRTVTLEADFEIDMKILQEISSFINERTSSRKLSYLRQNFSGIMEDYSGKDAPLIRLFIDSVDKLFENSKTTDRIHISGTQNLLSYPEFEDLGRVKGVVELIENEDIIIHLLDNKENARDGIKVLIGRELNNELLEDYSLIVSNYEVGPACGSIGLIGPKRMNYSKMVSLVKYFSSLIPKYIS
mgnify:CR=1 FL=1